MQWRTAGAFLNLGSAHIGGERLLDELLQCLRLLLFRDGSYDGFTHDIAAAVYHIGGGIEQSPIVSFMTCFICSPSSPAVLPTAALLTLSLPVFAGKKYRPESCFSNGSAKAGLRPRWNIQNQLASVRYFQQSKDGGQFFHPPSSEGGSPFGQALRHGKIPLPVINMKKAADRQPFHRYDYLPPPCSSSSSRSQRRRTSR